MKTKFPVSVRSLGIIVAAAAFVWSGSTLLLSWAQASRGPAVAVFIVSANALAWMARDIYRAKRCRQRAGANDSDH